MVSRVVNFASAAIALGLLAGLSETSVISPAAAQTSYVDDLVAQAKTALAAKGESRDVPRAVKLLTQAAGTGSAEAALILATVLATGDGVPAEPQRAETLLKTVAATGNPAADEGLGDLYRLNTPLKNAALAVAAYQKAVDGGRVSAMRKLAALMMSGEDVEKDPPRAASLLRLAIQSGDVRSGEEALGDLYRADTPIKDPAAAAAAYQRAADAGSTQAMRKLAMLLGKGDGVTAEPVRAEALINQAIEAGDVAWGNETLADFYLLDTPLKSPEKAIAALEAAGKAGNSGAIRKLAGMLIRGDQLPPDAAKAEKLLKQAIAGGDVRGASETLGDLYLNAREPRDPKRALAAYTAAADAGNPAAMRKIASMLIKGDGVAADPEKALALIQQSIAVGDTRYGNEALGEFYRTPSSLMDLTKAAAAFRLAADAGSINALRRLASMQLRGEGMAADAPAAAKLIQKLIASGEISAGHEALGDLFVTDSPLRDYAKAIVAYRTAADAGNINALRKLANIIGRGAPGIPADPAKAAKLFAEVVAGGDARGGNEGLGDLYRADTPLKDLAKAAAAYRAAADAGNYYAMSKLARMLASGEGVPADVEAAVAYLKQAIDLGDTQNAPKQLADLLLTGEPTAKQRAEALQYLDLAGSNGNAGAHMLAAQLLTGDVAKNSKARTQLVEHLKAAAALTSAEEVAAAMMHYQTSTLIFSVQEMLRVSGYVKGADGALGPQTQAAITKFCEEKAVAECAPDFVTVEFLESLLKA